MSNVNSKLSQFICNIATNKIAMSKKLLRLRWFVYVDFHKINWTIVYWTDIKILAYSISREKPSLLSGSFQIEKIILKILDWSSNKRFIKYQFKNFFKNHFFLPLDSINRFDESIYIDFLDSKIGLIDFLNIEVSRVDVDSVYRRTLSRSSIRVGHFAAVFRNFTKRISF